MAEEKFARNPEKSSPAEKTRTQLKPLTPEILSTEASFTEVVNANTENGGK